MTALLEKTSSQQDAGAPSRVLFAIPTLGRAGPDRVFYDLMRSFDRRRFDVHLAVSSVEGYYLQRLPEDVRVHQVSDDRGLLGRYPVGGLLRAVRRVRPHALVATLRMLLTAGVAKPLLPSRTKLILRVANQPSDNFSELQKVAPVKHRISHWLLRRALAGADRIVCQSSDMQRDVCELTGDKIQIDVIGNPVDLEQISALSQEAPAVLRGAPSVLCVARLMPQKGVDVLLEAFALLRDSKPLAHLTVVGEGPEREDLESRARHLGIQDAVTFMGFVENPYPLMAGSDLFALASRYEGFPNVVVEALACGTPVVASDCPGATRDILHEDEGGFLGPAQNAAGFAKTMIRALAAGPFDRDDLARACERRHALKTVTAAYEDICQVTES